MLCDCYRRVGLDSLGGVRPKEKSGQPSLGRGGLDRVGRMRIHRDLEPRVQGQLLQDVVDVALYRVGSDMEAEGDLFVA